MVNILFLIASTLQQAITIPFHFLTANHFRQISDTPLILPTMKNIIIIGGSYGGINTAHRILKQASKIGPFKITLVAPNTHLYVNLASPRSIIPGELADDKIFLPIVEGFKQYPANRFEFIIAYAESLDTDAKKITLSHATGKTTLEYDFLILATGSTPVGNTPFKELGSTKATKDALHAFQEQVKKAKTIVVAGAGVTGVEVSGELGYEYGKSKEIILVSNRHSEIARVLY